MQLLSDDVLDPIPSGPIPSGSMAMVDAASKCSRGQWERLQLHPFSMRENLSMQKLEQTGNDTSSLGSRPKHNLGRAKNAIKFVREGETPCEWYRN